MTTLSAIVPDSRLEEQDHGMENWVCRSVVLSYSPAVLVSCVMRCKAENTEPHCNSRPRLYGSDPRILKCACELATMDPHHIIKIREFNRPSPCNISAIEDVIRINFIQNSVYSQSNHISLPAGKMS